MITIVIIGAALLAIFGRMPWPALFALGVFTAVFFGAPKIVAAIAPASIPVGACYVTALQINVSRYYKPQKNLR
ncbi:TrbC/VirB2 family protein [Wolbachia pipientis]|uniref:TrbC/VirB2 family protein n=1 Tax=Wolbachia pipientis TaxID=955 RepID=A0A7G5CDX4_WOLPI|nr:TrbC/VirB2 family protein [Wolbachia pipientis]